MTNAPESLPADDRTPSHSGPVPVDAWDEPDESAGSYDLEARGALRRVAGLSTELADVTEVEYRQLRLERVVLVGVWTEGTAGRRGPFAGRARRPGRDGRLGGAGGGQPAP